MKEHAPVIPRRFLFTLWEGGGNVPPQLELAKRLVQRGHQVRVMSDQCNEAEVRAAGCTFISYTRAPNRPDKAEASTVLMDYQAKNPLQAFLRFRDTIMLKPVAAYAEDMLEELSRQSADTVVVSEFMLGPMIAAEKAAVPYAVMVPNPYMLPAKGLPPAGTPFVPARNALEQMRDDAINWVMVRAFNGGLPLLNAARARFGLSPLTSIFELNHRAKRVLVLTSPSFDFSATELPENVRYVGPVLDDPSWARDAELSSTANSADPLVAVSFSTTFQNQYAILQKVLDALAELKVRGLVTVGPSLDAARLRVPANVKVQRFAPHSQLFAQSAAVVTHAGHGTVIRALAAGAPLVCIPMGRDQGGNAVRVAARKAGKALSLGASVTTIRAAIREVVEQPHYRQAAQELAKSILQDAHSDQAVVELEQVAQAGKHAGSQKDHEEMLQSR